MRLLPEAARVVRLVTNFPHAVDGGLNHVGICAGGLLAGHAACQSLNPASAGPDQMPSWPGFANAGPAPPAALSPSASRLAHPASDGGLIQAILNP